MIDVDNKILRYLEAKQITMSLRKEADYLQNLTKNLEETIVEKNNYIKRLDNEIIASIKVEDLLNQISKLLDIDKNEIELEIIVIGGTYADTLRELYGYNREDAKALNSWLKIKLKDGTNICNKNLRLFNSLSEIQNDGRILFRHCRLEKTGFQRHNLIVDKNIKEIILNFRIDALDTNNYSEEERILPMAIRQCIKEEETKIQKKIKKRQFVKE